MPGSREFVCVRIGFSDVDPEAISRSMKRFADFLRSELRLFDEIGATENSLTILLPETGSKGAETVTDRVSVLADDLGIPLDISVYVFPDDDPLASLGIDFSNQKDLPPDSEQVNGHVHANGSANGHSHFPGSTPSGFVDDESEMAGKGGTVVLERVRKSKIVRLPGLDRLQVRKLPTHRPTAELTALIEHATPVWKRTMDIVCSLIGLVLTSPIFLLSAIAIRLESSGPVFFRQRREGKDGKIFEILKFRTMDNGAEERQETLRAVNQQDGPAFKVAKDPRVTRVGNFLRKSCIDELPQLVNILFGQMSLVGPRPLPVAESKNCRSWHRQRLTVLPGLTCLWQISGDRDMKFERWMRLDLEYIRRRSFWFDVKLICRTLLVALRLRGNT